MRFTILAFILLIHITSCEYCASQETPRWVWREFPGLKTVGTLEGTVGANKSSAYIISFGGFGEDDVAVNTVKVFRPASLRWETRSTRGEGPTPRIYAMGGVVEDRWLVVYGGLGRNRVGIEELQDLFSLDLETFEWTFRGSGMANSPGMRSEGATWIYMGKVYFFGGEAGSIGQNDLHVLDTSTWKFETLSYTCADGSSFTVPYQTGKHEEFDPSVPLTRNPVGPPEITFFENIMDVNRASISTAKNTVEANQTSFLTDKARADTFLTGAVSLLNEANSDSGSATISAKLKEFQDYLNTQTALAEKFKPDLTETWDYFPFSEGDCGHWRCLKSCAQAPPSPRQGPKASVIDDAAYITGGRRCEEGYNSGPRCTDPNVWKLNLTSLIWEKLYEQFEVHSSGETPSPFYRHAQVTFQGQLLIFGGSYYDSSGMYINYNTPYLFDTTKKEYSILEVAGTPPTERFHVTGHVLNNAIYFNEGYIIPKIFTTSVALLRVTVDASKTTASGYGLSMGLVNEPRSFKVQVGADVGDYWTGGDTIRCFGFTTKGGYFSADTIDDGDGSYTVKYEASVVGVYSVAVLLNGKTISGSPFTVTLKAELETDSQLFLIIGASVGSFIFIVLVVVTLVLCTRRRRAVYLAKKLANLEWVIDYSSLKIKGDGEETSQSKHSSLGARSERTFEVGEKTFCATASFNSLHCSFKKLSLEEALTITRDIALDVLNFREMKHDNVNPFVGAVVASGLYAILWEYAPKGSLRDAIVSPMLSDWTFKYSIASDIAKGLSYIHSSKLVSHGNLHGSNVVLTNSWVARITDFGPYSIWSLDKCSECASASQSETSNWYHHYFMPPEVLSFRKNLDLRIRCPGTPEGDVYSYSMVLVELFTLHTPYWEIDMEHEKIILQIKENGLRPNLLLMQDLEIPLPLVTLLHSCWENNPEHRPSSSSIVSKIKTINPDGNLPLLDNMIGLLKRYANNLEETIEERAKNLEKEKKRFEKVALEIFPPSILRRITNGEVIVPKRYDEVSIYFCDIVGFTGIASKSTPAEIVQFLSDFYVAFDGAITQYDAYKAATIGDAYTITSGLPEENGHIHSREICLLAHHLMRLIKEELTISHLPDVPLQLRAGCHTGIVSAGVVGHATPRYCLFGNAVAFTASLESSSLPMKIQISSNMFSHLQKHGYLDKGFVLTPCTHRDDDLQTYFLEGVPDQKAGRVQV
eukprot:Nk52_evm11s237 gene=Nk52_evmTU11s237